MLRYNAAKEKENITMILNSLINQIENVASGIQNEISTVGGHVCSNKLYNMAAHYRDVRNIVRNTYIAPPSPAPQEGNFSSGGGNGGGGGGGSRF